MPPSPQSQDDQDDAGQPQVIKLSIPPAATMQSFNLGFCNEGGVEMVTTMTRLRLALIAHSAVSALY